MKKDVGNYNNIDLFEDEENKESNKPRKDIKIIVFLCALLSISAFVYFAFIKEAKDVSNDYAKESIIDLNDIVTNLSTSSRNPVYINVGIRLKASNNIAAKAIRKNLPQIESALIVYIRELTPMDINAPAGTMMLIEGIKTRVNTIISPDGVDSVILKSIVIK